MYLIGELGILFSSTSPKHKDVIVVYNKRFISYSHTNLICLPNLNISDVKLRADLNTKTILKPFQKRWWICFCFYSTNLSEILITFCIYRTLNALDNQQRRTVRLICSLKWPHILGYNRQKYSNSIWHTTSNMYWDGNAIISETGIPCNLLILRLSSKTTLKRITSVFLRTMV